MCKRSESLGGYPTGVVMAASVFLVAIGLLASAQEPPTATPTTAPSQTAPSQLDEAGVRAAVSKRIDGSKHLDARLSAQAFSDDAIWINAFGRRLVGRAAIEKWFTEMYADPGYAQRKVLVPSEIAEIVFLRPDVAVARIFSRHGDQRLTDGTMIAERRTHNTMTLTREPDGWKVRYEIVTDERDGPAHRAAQGAAPK
jgi:uncharacterized protein (TIGR02246 family)